MGKISLFAAACLLAADVLLAGCNENACLDNKSAIPLAGFYDGTTLRAISVDSLQIGGIGAPDDSLLIDNENASEVYLPMRSGQSATSFCIHYDSRALRDPANNDTLNFSYEAIPYFASEECGAMYIYRVHSLEYTRHLIDSVGIVDSLITNANRQYMHIFFRTSSGEGGNR